MKLDKHVQDWFASDLFSLGMSILELVFSASMEDVYSNGKVIDFKMLSVRTFQIRNQKLRRFLEGLLHPIAQKRVTTANEIDSQIRIVSVNAKSNT